MSAGILGLSLLVMVLILLLNAFFVATEFALVASRRSKIKELAAEGHSMAKIVQKLQADMGRSVSGTQLGITLCSIGLGLVADHSINELINYVFGVSLPAGLGVVLSFVVLTGLHVVIGEQVPKFIAISLPEKVAMRMAPVFRIYCAIAWPFIWVLDRLAALILLPFGLRKPSGDGHSGAHSPDEFEILFEESQQAGQLGKRETDLLTRVLDLRDLTMDNVMVPMEKVDALPIERGLTGVLKVVSRTHHSRIPVYRDHPDNIVGVLYARDLFRWWKKTLADPQKATRDFEPEDFIRPAFLVERSHKASALLDEMRKRKVQIAIVKDGGKTIGIVTMEDLLEELVGEIYDEHDKVTPDMDDE